MPLRYSETDNRTGGIRVRFWQLFWTDLREEFLEVNWGAPDFLPLFSQVVSLYKFPFWKVELLGFISIPASPVLL